MFIATDFFDADFWDRVHGGSTHLPIALALTSALLDGDGSIAPSGKFREGFRFSGYFTLLLAALGAVPAVISGLMLTKWDAVGSGVTLLDHYIRLAFFGSVSGVGRLAFDRATSNLESWFLDLSHRNPDHSGADQYRGILGRRNRFEPLARKSR
jgi:drug/metabolite transporter (DMT)-like permease